MTQIEQFFKSKTSTMEYFFERQFFIDYTNVFDVLVNGKMYKCEQEIILNYFPLFPCKIKYKVWDPETFKTAKKKIKLRKTRKLKLELFYFFGTKALEMIPEKLKVRLFFDTLSKHLHRTKINTYKEIYNLIEQLDDPFEVPTKQTENIPTDCKGHWFNPEEVMDINQTARCIHCNISIDNINKEKNGSF